MLEEKYISEKQVNQYVGIKGKKKLVYIWLKKRVKKIGGEDPFETYGI